MEYIIVRGARTHNLKNVSVRIPRGKMTVITGPSGSGKSSLAFDTLYAEGQRRYVESLSVYARQFLELMPQADVDAVEGLSPAIAIDQQCGSASARSSVGTMTEIADYLRLLFARGGIPCCPVHGVPLTAMPIAEITDRILVLSNGARAMILAPAVRQKSGDQRDFFAGALAQGFSRFRIDGEVTVLDEAPSLDPAVPHAIDIVVDRLRISSDARVRLAESCQTAAELGNGRVWFCEMDTDLHAEFSTRYACPSCDWTLSEVEPSLFSLSRPQGRCARCDGSGTVEEAGGTVAVCPECQGKCYSADALSVVLSDGERSYSIADVEGIALNELDSLLGSLTFDGVRADVGPALVKEIRARLRFLCEVGLGYLTLGRRGNTLSGGETQRIRLAAQIGSGLSGVMYVLDEPSIGLHQRDNDRLLSALEALRDLGNTLIVVEHDEETIRRADYVIDMGPGAGEAGGEVTAEGTPEELKDNPASLTGQYLSGKRWVQEPDEKRKAPDAWLTVSGAHGHNLKNVTLRIPVGLLTAVTGVSGSGKSSLIIDTLYAAAAAELNHASAVPLPFDVIEGLSHFDKVVTVDQQPVGRTPRSTPATYTGLFSLIREVFGSTLTARERGYGAGRFSFNTKGGRCEACGGDGAVRMQMHFLPDVFVPCSVCGGRRYNRETLEVKYKGHDIADVLDMTVTQAADLFEAYPKIRRILQALSDVGLGYIRLGQSAVALSGGEAQRLKLAAELARPENGRTLYILDEPTTGLHFEDIAQLIKVLRHLTDAGNTVVVIEHCLEIVKGADYVIDIGPEGGAGGGEILFEGTPEALAASSGRSITALFVRRAIGL